PFVIDQGESPMSKYALCVGINNYPGTANDLSGCINDAQDWSAVLSGRGFKVDQLIDKDASKLGIMEGIRRLVKNARAGDLVVFQYSGHGSYVPDESGDEDDGVDEVICPCDVGPDSYLSDDEIYDLFSAHAAGVRIVFLSDSCFSGSVS